MVCVVFRAVAGSQEIQLTWCFIMQLYSQQSQHSHAHTRTHIQAGTCTRTSTSLTDIESERLFCVRFFHSQTCYRDPSTWRRLTCLETGWTPIRPWLPWSPNPRAPQQVRRTNTHTGFSSPIFLPLPLIFQSRCTPPCLWNVWSAVSPPSSGRRERETRRTKLPGTESWKCAYLLNEACQHSNISLICTMTAVMTLRGLPGV